MSRENVEIVRAGLDALARGDLQEMLRASDPKIELEPRLSALQGSYSGHDGVREFFADLRENMPVLQVDHPDVRDLDDQVLALGTFRIGGPASGIEAEAPFAIVAKFRDGLIIHLKDYGGDMEEALTAVGLTQ
jgi:ketosteroid isomerase-like protein